MIAINKLDRIFEVAPWLKESKNIVHLGVLDPDSDPKKPKLLPGLSWAELYVMNEAVKSSFCTCVSMDECDERNGCQVKAHSQS